MQDYSDINCNENAVSKPLGRSKIDTWKEIYTFKCWHYGGKARI
jgi:hypothetical protein